MGDVGSISSVNGESHVQSLGLEARLHLQNSSSKGCQKKGKLHSVHIQYLMLNFSNILHPSKRYRIRSLYVVYAKV